MLIKGTVNEIFYSRFFSKQLILTSLNMPESDFDFFRIFMVFFALKIFIYNVFRATRSKTTPLPAALNQARGIDTMYCFY
jgi:hypothetical protein